jgi:multidrug efflux pump
VIASGLGIGTLFTLYVVPAFYMLLAPDEVQAAQSLPEPETLVAAKD